MCSIEHQNASKAFSERRLRVLNLPKLKSMWSVGLSKATFNPKNVHCFDMVHLWWHIFCRSSSTLLHSNLLHSLLFHSLTMLEFSSIFLLRWADAILWSSISSDFSLTVIKRLTHIPFPMHTTWPNICGCGKCHSFSFCSFSLSLYSPFSPSNNE